MGVVAWIAERNERNSKKYIEANYMKKKSQSIYMALEEEDLDFFWDEKEVLEFDRLWESRMNILDIAAHFDRDPDEVMLLAIDRARKGFIAKRKGGIVGKGSRQK
jgi:hypothetical protein